MKGFMNHCGGRHITREELGKLTNPVPMTETHYPIRHDYFLKEVQNALENAGYKIVHEEFSLQRFLSKKDGKLTQDNMFGLMELRNCNNHEDMAKLVGLRNSSTMQFRANMGCGNRVFVCDNLSFSANIVVGRRHTKNIFKDLPKMLSGAITELNKQFEENEKRVEAYKAHSLDRLTAHDIIMVAMRAGAIPPSMLKPWVNTFYNPTHDAFKNRDCWSLYNAFTEVAKKWSYPTMQDRTHLLTKVMDKMVLADAA